MNKVCTKCNSTEKYYAKGLCTPCYNKERRLRLGDEIRKKEHARYHANIERERELDRARHWRDRDKRLASMLKYQEENKEKLREYDKLRWKNNPDRRRKMREYIEANRDKVRAVDRAEYHRNKDKHIARVMERRANKGKATPKWLTPEQRKEMEDLYKNRPDGFHVDHIVPLQGENVSGLHVPWNLQYLPATENLRKSNKWL